MWVSTTPVAALCFFLVYYMAVEAEVKCPQENLAQPTILADPTNCSRFYICDHGRPFLQECSGELFFNPALKVCDRRDDVVFCEYDDLLYIKPYCDCHKYVICDNGTMYVQDCPKGYHFESDDSVLGYKVFSDDPCDVGDCE